MARLWLPRRGILDRLATTETTASIAADCPVGRKTVGCYRREVMGIRIGGGRPASFSAVRIRSLLRAGYTYAETAATVGCSRGTVAAAVRAVRSK